MKRMKKCKNKKIKYNNYNYNYIKKMMNINN